MRAIRFVRVSLFAVASLAAFVAHAAEELSKGVFVARIMDQEIGRETFEIVPDGWSAKGKLDLFGTQKVDYEIVEKRTGEKRPDEKTTIAFKGKQNGADVTIDATLIPGEFQVTINGAKEPKTLKFDVTLKTPMLYQNLAWCYFIDIGQRLATLAAEGLQPGEKMNLIAVEGAALFAMDVRQFKSAVRLHAGMPVAVWDFDLTIAGNVDATFTTTNSGVPIYVGVAAQKLDVVVEGYEDLKPKSTDAHTVVDSGDWRPKLSKSEGAIKSEKQVFMPMRDKVKLAADVVLPATEGKFPAILVRTPYSRESMGLLYGNYYASRGYAVVAQDVRGRFDSEGKFEPMRHETEDGSDTIDWIAAQPWSNGDVGMIGGSYLGWVQWHAAKSGNPHLKAIVPQVSPPDPQENLPYEGGVFVMGSVWWAFIAEDLSRIGNSKTSWMKNLSTLPLTDIDSAFGIKLPFLDEWVQHPPHDSWWDAMSYQKDFSKLDVPALNISGWFDGDQPGAPSNFINMRKSAKSERARKGQWLVMGPWTHLYNTTSRIGDWDFGPDAVVDLSSVELRWFDHYLKGIDNGVDREDPVLVFTMGENKWHREKDWPLPQTKWTNVFLGGSGKANKRDGGGTLALAASESPADHYAYDPSAPSDENPDFDDLTGKAITEDLSTRRDRDDALDFTSPALEGPVEITGPFSAVLSVSTDAKDTDFAAALLRIERSGKTTAIAEGIQRLRYRNGNAKEDFAKPGDTSKVTIDLWAHGLTLEAGDRLRLVVTSSLFPGYARNLNTGEPDATATKPVVAHQTIFHDGKRPSYLVLPVIPREPRGDLRFAAQR